MSRWRYSGDSNDDDNNFAGFDKIRRKHSTAKQAKAHDDGFELAESRWPKQDKETFAARVVEVHKRYCFVSPERVRGKIATKDVWLATLARKWLITKRVERNLVCVGDRVLCSVAHEGFDTAESDLPKCVIDNMAPRTSRIARVDPTDETRFHVLASNIDQMIITSSYLNPLIKWGLIDRYLVLAESEGIRPIIALNKRDALAEADPAFRDLCAARAATYRTMGYTVIDVQANAADALKDPGIITLRDMLKDNVSLFTGHSGVGKSSLVNLFRPEIVQDVEPNSDIFYKGRHTTSFASFLKLKTGGYVIDTPGIRSFVLPDMEAIDLSRYFADLAPFADKCEYRECAHIDETDCAVKRAVEEGLIADWRYKNYMGIYLKSTGRQGRVRAPVEEIDTGEDFDW